MKKTAVLMCLLACLPYRASAHPPKEIEASFDLASKTLKAVIHHVVRNRKKHYIRRIVITLNGKEYTTILRPIQKTLTEEDMSIEIPEAKLGDSIVLTAYCTEYGKKSKQLSVVEPEIKP